MINRPVRSLCVAGLTLAALAACATPSGVIAPVDAAAPLVETAPAPVTAPQPIDLSADRISALETRMGDYIRHGQLYGIHTRLAQRGEIVSDYYAGLRGLEPDAPIAPDTIYRIYSMSKPITGVAMMMLWEDGKFELDDPITKYVPEFADLKVLDGVSEDGTPILVDMQRPPTMRELMSHTSGFAYGLSGSDPVNTAYRDLNVLDAPDLQTFIDRTATIPLLHQPGEAWVYSIGMDIQGYMIEQLSGQSFGEYLQTRLFAPLGMVDTGFYVPAEEYHRFSEVYGFDPETGALAPVPFPSVQFRRETVGFESGGGGLVSTMNDYSRFAQMLVNRGELDGVRLLKPETIDLITANAMPDGAVMTYDGVQLPGLGMGLTFGTVEDRALAETLTPQGSYFWGGAASTWFWIDPVNELYFIGMVQIFDHNRPGGAIDFRGDATRAVYGPLSGE